MILGGETMTVELFNDKLIRGASRGSLHMVLQALKSGADIDHIDPNSNILGAWGKTALIIAVQHRHTDIALALIDRGAALDIQDHNLCTALIYGVNNRAISVGTKNQGNKDKEIAIIDSLLNAGANVNLQNNSGATALMTATAMGDAETVQKLIDMGAVLDVQNENGWTALMLAVSNGHLDIVTLLIKAGASLDIQKSDKKTALIIATKQGDFDITMKLINSGANVSIKDCSGRTALEIGEERSRAILKGYLRKLREQSENNTYDLNFY